eukprot:496479-Pyramimonas_sp.AAC.1
MDSSLSRLASVRGPGCRRWISKAASACTLGDAPRLLVPGLPHPSRGLIYPSVDDSSAHGCAEVPERPF